MALIYKSKYRLLVDLNLTHFKFDVILQMPAADCKHAPSIINMKHGVIIYISQIDTI